MPDNQTSAPDLQHHMKQISLMVAGVVVGVLVSWISVRQEPQNDKQEAVQIQRIHDRWHRLDRANASCDKLDAAGNYDAAASCEQNISNWVENGGWISGRDVAANEPAPKSERDYLTTEVQK
jgi:hypothetical protein